MNEPKTQTQLWLEEAPQIILVTVLIATFGGFFLSLGAWLFLFVLVGIGGLV